MTDLLKKCRIAMLLLLAYPIHIFAEDVLSLKDRLVSSLPDDPSSPKLKITVQLYPDTIQFGDTVYVICTFENVDDKVIEGIVRSYQYRFDDFRWRYFQCAVTEGRSRGLVYENLPEDKGARRSMSRRPTQPIPLQPGEKRVMYVYAFEFPPLEDIYHPFWLKLQSEFNDSNPRSRGSRFEMRFTTSRLYEDRPEVMERVLKYPSFWIRSRSEKEMELLAHWYSQCRKEHIPLVRTTGYNVLSFKYPFEKRGTIVEFSSDDGNKVMVNNNEYTPWMFTRIGNRKPPAHLCPTTWQGWQELEESLTPSTMRDEIRLTRMIVQYCDTQDSTVLDELKEWFADMNEIQRTYMARFIRLRTKEFSFYNENDFIEQFCEMYRVIQGYDITAKTDSEIEWLRKLELLE